MGTFPSTFFFQAILFAIDLSNPGRLAESGVHLVEILQLVKGEAEIKVLIVFTKADLLEESLFQKVLRETRALLRIDFLTQSGYNLETLTISSQTDFGLDQLVKFLSKVSK